ncbi:similar to An18g00340 [Aspergillus luchuensis]|uniref:Similar to An18g00340 n=1 Tax=Aspergillus kawachii TaxID=1069201 RepID=A0A146F4C8_ASPKA|nr:similar to An18g00340 [Aspergillus luchuensis]
MVEPISVEQIPISSKQNSRMPKTKTLLFNILLILLSLCAVVALIVASIALKKTQELGDFKSSLFISDLERIFNSTAYAIAKSGPDAPACSNLTAETVTGQTTLPDRSPKYYKVKLDGPRTVLSTYLTEPVAAGTLL